MFSIRYEEEAHKDLAGVRPFDLRRIFDEVDAQLSKRPLTPSRRKKMLRGVIPPWESAGSVWQLRVGGFRVYDDVDEARQEVIVRAVRHKGTKTTEEIL